MVLNWNEKVFACICHVNKQRYSGYQMPEIAAKRLYMMESCLSSGDGLSCDSAFRTDNPSILQGILGLLGISESIREIRKEGSHSVIVLTENPYGIANLYFALN